MDMTDVFYTAIIIYAIYIIIVISVKINDSYFSNRDTETNVYEGVATESISNLNKYINDYKLQLKKERLRADRKKRSMLYRRRKTKN